MLNKNTKWGYSVNVINTYIEEDIEYTQSLKIPNLRGIFKHSIKMIHKFNLISSADKGEKLPKGEGKYFNSNLPLWEK